MKTGFRDLWSHWTKDSADFDWEAASSLERASKHVYNSTCIKCHENLFPAKLTREGSDAHLYYNKMTEIRNWNTATRLLELMDS